MRFRFVRPLLAALVVLSLSLWVVVVAVWIRSYWRFDWFGYEGPVRPSEAQWGGNGSSTRGQFEGEFWSRRNARAVPAPASPFEHLTIPATTSARAGLQ